MINRIKSLKYIRGFIDFDASTIQLTKKSVIYAPNGTGKTTLSRLLESVSTKESIEDICSQEIEDPSLQDFIIEVDSSEINKSSYTNGSCKFLIFNSDYIDRVIRTKNFSDNDVTGEVIIPIGKESNEISNIKTDIDHLEKERHELYIRLVQKFTSFKDIKIQDKNYAKNDYKVWEWSCIERLVEQKDYKITIPSKPDLYNCCEQDFKDISDLTEDDRIENQNIAKVSFQNINFEQILSELNKQKTFPILDETVRSDINNITSRWIAVNYLEDGVKLSLEENECFLCKRPLDINANDLFDKYQSYFANEESKYKRILDTNKIIIETLRKTIENKNNNLREAVNTIAKILGIKQSWAEINTNPIIEKLQELERLIQDKINDPSTSLSLNYEFRSEITKLNAVLQFNESLIENINQKIDKTSRRKTELREEIGKKFLFDIYIENKSLVDEIDNRNNDLSKLKELLKQEVDKLPKKDVANNIAKLANKFLHSYLYINKYKILSKDGVIKLHLNDKDISQNGHCISEGEKTLIALCYFFACSIQKLSNISEFDKGVFIIDDPVNSTGYNYFFGVCNLIKHFHIAIRKEVWGEETDENIMSIQKIILTHNTQFFNVLREHTYKKAQFLNLTTSSFIPIKPNHLKSEFDNALSNVKKVVLNNEDLNIGNDLRRIFETLRHFYGYSEFNAETLRSIFRNFSDHEHHAFYMVVNYYSHGNPESHTDPLSADLETFKEQFKLLIESSDFKEKWNSI